MNENLDDLLAAAEQKVLAGQTHDGIRLATDALNKAHHAKNKAKAGQALVYLGALQRMASQHAEALHSLSQAEDLFDAERDTKGLANVFLQRGQMALDQGDYVDAIETMGRGFDLCSKLDDPLLRSRFLVGLGIASARLRDFERARRNYRQAIDILGVNGDLGALANATHCLGVLDLRHADELPLQDLHRQTLVKNAVRTLKRALEMAGKAGRLRLEGMCLNEIGRAWRLLGDCPQVLKYCQSAIDIFRKLPAPKDECEALLHMAQAQLEQGAAQRAVELAQASLQQAQQCGFRPAERDAHELLARCHEAAGNIPDAYNHLKAAREVDRSLQNGEAMRRIERFELHQEIERSRAERRALVEQAAELDRLAFEDSLTHLANRRALERQWEHSLASGVEHCSLVMLDLDRFKVVNDRFGHAVGDQVLITLAGLLRANARAGDVSARWGGEEFLLFLPAMPGAKAGDIAERIRLQVEHRSWTDIHPDLTLTISAGVVSGPLSMGLDALVQQADEAMYRAKAQGRNCVVVGQGTAAS